MALPVSYKHLIHLENLHPSFDMNSLLQFIESELENKQVADIRIKKNTISFSHGNFGGGNAQILPDIAEGFLTLKKSKNGAILEFEIFFYGMLLKYGLGLTLLTIFSFVHLIGIVPTLITIGLFLITLITTYSNFEEFVYDTLKKFNKESHAYSIVKN